MKITFSKKFRRNYKKNYINQEKVTTKFSDFLEYLKQEKPLPKSYRKHRLKGSMKKYWEVHLFPDILVIYNEDGHMISMENIGSHSELFK